MILLENEVFVFSIAEILAVWNKSGISVVDILGVFSMIGTNGVLMFIYLHFFIKDKQGLSTLSKDLQVAKLIFPILGYG